MLILQISPKPCSDFEGPYIKDLEGCICTWDLGIMACVVEA